MATASSHPANLLPANAPAFLPAKTCRFHIQGRCRNGQDCTWLHVAPLSTPSASSSAAVDIHAFQPENVQSSERQLKGACVCFVDGARIASVDLSSTAAMDNPPTCNAQVCTVVCSWYNPSRIVWLHYRSKAWASSASTRFDEKFQGRRIDTKLQSPPKHHSVPRAIWSVQLTNIRGNATEADMQTRLEGLQPDRIVLGKPTSETQEDTAVELVTEVLSRSGRKLKSFDAEPNTDGTRMKAYARFERAVDVRAALELDGTTLPDLGSKLFVDQVAATTIPVLRCLYPVLHNDIQALQTSGHGGVRISTKDQRKSKAISLRIYGSKVQAVSKVTAQLGRLLAGTVVIDERRTALWHGFFATPEGLSALKNIYRTRQIFIYRDMRKQQLVFYGPATLYEATYHSIVDILATNTSSYLIPLHGVAFANALSGTFRQIVKRFGRKNAKLDIVSKPPVVILNGSLQDFDNAKVILLDHSGPPGGGLDINRSEDCPVCMSEAVDPIKLGCDHLYCRDCFEALCREVDGKKKPISCVGDLDNCTHVPPLTKLQTILGHAKFEKLLETSFEQYVRASPERVQYCPTADCPTIYEVSADPGVFTCTNCLVSICTKCRSLSHDELTCEEAQSKSVEEQISEEDRKRLGVQYCPDCKTALYKDAGCNHVICSGCKTHICWFCLDTFSTSDACYEHMTATHGDFGGGIVPLNLEVEQMREWEAEGAEEAEAAGAFGAGVRWNPGFNPLEANAVLPVRPGAILRPARPERGEARAREREAERRRAARQRRRQAEQRVVRDFADIQLNAAAVVRAGQEVLDEDVVRRPPLNGDQ